LPAWTPDPDVPLSAEEREKTAQIAEDAIEQWKKRRQEDEAESAKADEERRAKIRAQVESLKARESIKEPPLAERTEATEQALRMVSFLASRPHESPKTPSFAAFEYKPKSRADRDAEISARRKAREQEERAAAQESWVRFMNNPETNAP
jgi:hypothetical protein